MITAVIDAGQHYCQAVSDLWQWDYGQTLRIQGVTLPAAVEIQFSTTERIGETVTRIGVTKEGVTEVPIPDTLLEGGGTTQDYTIYAFVYIENGDSGKTEYRVSMKVRARPKPEAHATPEEGELFRQAIVAVTESADRAESARKSAETASNQAESAKNAAEAAAGSAQVSADEAKKSKENAETAVENAEAFKTEIETAKAEAVQAAADATAAKNSAEEARAAAEKAKAAADADKEAAEAAQAKAEAAQVAAENAEVEAKKAQTATETARRETETAKAEVETMQSTVAGYADNAKNAKEAAETAKAEAETAKNDAAQAKEAAEKAKSGTAADRETAETASKVAQISATSAEESAKKAEAAKEEIQESADQIQKNAAEIDSLKEDLSNSNLIDIFEKKITTTTDKWDRPISFRNIWFPFTAKVNCNIKSISFNCLVNNDYIDSSNKFHCELLQNDGKTIIASATTGYEWVNNSTFVNFSFDLNGMIHKGGNYYLHIYCLTRSFSYTLAGYKNVYEDDYILSSPPARVNNAGNATFEQSGTHDMIRLFVSMSISGKNITDISEIKDDIVNVKSDISEIKGIEPIKLYVSKSGSDITGDGSKEKPYASIFHANESIIDSSAEKPYKIIVAKGTYTDLQEKYAGDTTAGSYKGVNVKDHIYIESEDIEHPELTVLEWDGFTGFTSETYTEKIRSDMCLFHFNGRKASRKWASGLKGLTLKGMNTRYLFHIEANSDQNILIENCIFDWKGTPKGQYHNIPVIGCGGSYNQTVTFKNCILKNSESTAGVQWHDNVYPYSDLNIYHGADFNFIGCKFDGLDLQMRSTNAEREMPFSLIVEKCGGIRKAVFSQGGSATKNYWRGHVVSSFIAEDKISNATDETNEVTPFEKK